MSLRRNRQLHLLSAAYENKQYLWKVITKRRFSRHVADKTIFYKLLDSLPKLFVARPQCICVLSVTNAGTDATRLTSHAISQVVCIFI